MKKSTKIFLSSVAASIILIGCGGGGSSSSASSTSTTETVSGTAVDGPVAYAKVCLDLNFNGKCDPDEKEFNTSAEGKFTIIYNSNEQNASFAPVVVMPTFTSYDTSTGNLYTITMSSPRTAGQSEIIVSPLTTIAAEAVYQKVKENNGSITLDDITGIIKKISDALDLNGTDITKVNPAEKPKLLVTAVTLANVIKKDGNISKVADSIVEENETNITAALPADYQSVYTAAVSAVDENTSINPDLLQQAVETAIDNNNTTVVRTVVNSEGNETAVAEALVGGYLNSVMADLVENRVSSDLNGNKLNLDFNATKAALELYNDYGITDIASLNDKYNSEDLNTSEVNVTALLQTYNLLEKVKTAMNNLGVGETEVDYEYYYDLDSGKLIDLSDLKSFYFGVQSVLFNDSEFVIEDNKLYIVKSNETETYNNYIGVDSPQLSDVIYEANNEEPLDLNASLLKDAYTVSYTVDGKNVSTVYNIDVNSAIYSTVDGESAIKLDDNHYFIPEVVNNVINYESMNGYIATVDSNLNVTSLLPAKAVYYDANLQDFLSKLDFTPAEINTGSLKTSKFIISGDNVPMYFTPDGKYYSVGEGTYDVENNVLVLYDNGEVDSYVAFKNFNNGTCEYEWYSVKDAKMYSGTLNIEPYDASIQTYFNPVYYNNNTLITLAADDDIMNFDQNGNIQFTIKDDSGTGVQCTTNFTNVDDFKNAFVNGELTLNAADGNISCLYLNNGTPVSADTQTEIIQFIDNNDGTYQVQMVNGGYFSGSDYNITGIEDSLLTTEFTTTNTASSSDVLTQLQDILSKEGVSAQALDVNGKTLFKLSDGGLPIYFNSDNTYFDVGEDSNDSGTWSIENNIVVLDGNKTAVAAVSDINDSMVKIQGVDDEGEFNDTLIYTSYTKGQTVDDSTVTNIFDNNGLEFYIFNTSDVNGSTFVSNDNTTYKFDTNGTLEISSPDDENITTTWSVNNGVVSIAGPDGGKVYAIGYIPAGVSGKTGVFFVFTDSEGHILKIENELLTKTASTITDVDSFLNALQAEGITPVAVTADDLNGTTIVTGAFGEYQGSIQLDTNGSFTDNDVDENNTQITESGTWEINSNVLVLNYENNDTVYVAVKDMNGSIIDVVGYDGEDGGMFTDTAVILNKGMGATLTSLDDFNNLFLDGTPAVTITATDYDDTNWTATIYGINFEIHYNSDGSYFETWSGNGNEGNITGTWEVNETENVLIIKADNYATSLVRVIDANSTSAKTVFVDVDANGTILDIGALIFNKVQ